MKNEPHCPECGYTVQDALIHWDHERCNGRIPGHETPRQPPVKEQPVGLPVVTGYDIGSPNGDFGSLTFRKGEVITAVLYDAEAKAVADYIKQLAVAKPEVDIEAAVVALAKRMAKNTEGTDAGYKGWIESMGRIFEAEAKTIAEAWGIPYVA